MYSQCQSNNEAAGQARVQAEPGGAHGAGQCCSACLPGGTTVFPIFQSTHPMRHLFLKHLPPPRPGSG